MALVLAMLAGISATLARGVFHARLRVDAYLTTERTARTCWSNLHVQKFVS